VLESFEMRAQEFVRPMTGKRGQPRAALRVLFAVLAIAGAIIAGAALNAIWHPGPDALAFTHARDCSGAAADPTNCVQSTTALITESYADTGGNLCSAVISFGNGRSERLPFDCDNRDVMTKGATLDVKLWRGQIVQFGRADMVTWQGPSLMLPLLIGATILGVLMLAGGTVGLVLLRRSG
jgi:hypothetical protein